MLYFTQEELSFVAKQFGYNHLEGADFVKFNKKECISSLTEKGYVVSNGKRLELSNSCRLLMSAWESVRYTLVNDNCISDEHVHAILASSERIISYSLHHSDIQIAMCDFSVEVMDKIITDYLDIADCENRCTGFHITLSDDAFLDCFGTEISDQDISKKTGLALSDVSLIKQSFASENATTFIVQDVIENIGCMGKLVRYADGYVLIKHVVPNSRIANQKIVITKGNRQDIVDSIYIL